MLQAQYHAARLRNAALVEGFIARAKGLDHRVELAETPGLFTFVWTRGLRDRRFIQGHQAIKLLHAAQDLQAQYPALDLSLTDAALFAVNGFFLEGMAA